MSDFNKLLSLLALDTADDDTFVGHCVDDRHRVFGGQLMGQSVVAAGHTVSDALHIHNLSAHFIRGASPNAPLEYRVTRVRETRTYANRQVNLFQNGELIYSALISYHKPEKGLEHDPTMPDVADPESLPTIEERLAGFESIVPVFVNAMKPIDMRYCNDTAWQLRKDGGSLPHNRVWMRARGEIGDSPIMNAAVLCFASDTTILDSILTRHGLSWGYDRVMTVTVNQTMWFHRPVHFDEWNLYASESTQAFGQRGLSHGTFFDGCTGGAVVSLAQEAIVKYFPKNT